jgi:5-methylcytosine-specific restriction enzyme subunit McrC
LDGLRLGRGAAPIRLVENGAPHEIALPSDVGAALAGSSFVDCWPALHAGRWEIRPRSSVGAVRVGDVEVHVTPKIPIARVIFCWGTRAASGGRPRRSRCSRHPTC